MTPHNTNCDGSHCRTTYGPVKLYPLGAGGNLILCQGCFAHENRYRLERGAETGQPDNWPTVAWSTARIYPEE